MSTGKKILISFLVLSLIVLFFWLTTIKFFCSEDVNKSTFEYETKGDSSITNSIPFKDTTPFITYWDLSNSQQIPYKTKKLTSAKVKLFPNYGTRQNQDRTKLIDVYGINQFFMDYDLTTGYVHRYTQNFFKKQLLKTSYWSLKGMRQLLMNVKFHIKKLKT